MTMIKPFSYHNVKSLSCIWKNNLIPVFLIIILIFVWKLGNQIWIYNLFLMGIRNKAMTMYQNFSKTEDQFLQGNVLVTSKDYLNNWECSVQKSVYHILAGLKLKKIFPSLYFVKRSIIDRYMERPNAIIL